MLWSSLDVIFSATDESSVTQINYGMGMKWFGYNTNKKICIGLVSLYDDDEFSAQGSLAFILSGDEMSELVSRCLLHRHL